MIKRGSYRLQIYRIAARQIDIHLNMNELNNYKCIFTYIYYINTIHIDIRVCVYIYTFRKGRNKGRGKEVQSDGCKVVQPKRVRLGALCFWQVEYQEGNVDAGMLG